MHPKKLLDICIDAVIHQTMVIQQCTKDDMKKLEDVQRIWDDLWLLPRNIPVRAGELLRAHLGHPMPKDFSANLLIGLAANLLKITTQPDNNQLASMHFSSFPIIYNPFKSQYQLQELNLCGVDMASKTYMLAPLLSKCPHLIILNLGGNISREVLEAAKSCPITVLRITERQAWNPRLKLECLVEIFFGPNNSALQKIHEEPLDLKTAWPNLTELSTGYCKTNCDFFVLAFIAFKKLRYFSSSIVHQDRCLRRYLEMKREIPNWNQLSLGRFTVILSGNLDMEVLVSFFRNLENLSLLMHNSADEQMCNNIKKFSNAALSPRQLQVVHVRHICPGEPPRGFFSDIGQNVKTLELHGGLVEPIDLRDIGELLSEFPVLEMLKLSMNKGLKCSTAHPVKKHCFQNVKSLTIGDFVEYEESYRYLTQMFPQVQELVLSHSKVRVEKIVCSFRLWQELRVIKVSDLNLVHLSELLELPRGANDGRRFEFHAPVKSFSKQDAQRIVNSGWNYFPTPEHSFKNAAW